MRGNTKFLVGIDEAGRGPLAGPVAVGTCIFLSPKVVRLFKGVKDSKKLTPQKREDWFRFMKEQKKRGEIDFYVSFSSNSIIDKKGISFAIQKALQSNLLKLKIKPKKAMILLDGGLRAPVKFLYQRTIIKGDEKFPIISLASIAAKVLRDRKMVRYSRKYPHYKFDIHKGYGTFVHRKKIHIHGFSPIHRKSYLKNFDN